MSTNTNIPGLKLPTQKAMLAGTARDSAIQENNNTNNKLNNLSAAVGGSRKKARRRTGGAIAVPQFQMQYSDQSGPGGSPNNQVQQNSKISTQQNANAVYDKAALTKGGKRKRRTRKGGNADWKWGCYSGGKKKSKTRRRPRRKTRRRR